MTQSKLKILRGRNPETTEQDFRQRKIIWGDLEIDRSSWKKTKLERQILKLAKLNDK